MKQQKFFVIIYFFVVLQLLVRWLAISNNWMIFLWCINMLMLYFFFPSIKLWIETQTKTFFRTGLHLTSEQYTLLRNWTSYIFSHYLFMFSIIYLLVVAIDYLFANILFLHMRGWLFLLIVSFLVSYHDIIKGDVRLWNRKLSPADGIFLVACIITICLMLNFQMLPFYQNYFYSILVGFLSWIVCMLLLWFSTLRKIITHDIFIIWSSITILFFFIWLWNMFPNIKQSLTHEEIVTQTWYMYVNCPTDLPK